MTLGMRQVVMLVLQKDKHLSVKVPLSLPDINQLQLPALYPPFLKQVLKVFPDRFGGNASIFDCLQMQEKPLLTLLLQCMRIHYWSRELA